MPVSTKHQPQGVPSEAEDVNSLVIETFAAACQVWTSRMLISTGHITSPVQTTK